MGPFRYEFFAHSVIFLLGYIFRGVSVDLGTGDVIDLIQSLNTSQSAGYSYISGPNNRTPAIFLEDASRYLAVPDQVVTKALEYLRDKAEITFLATVKQEIGDSGTILSFSSDIIRFLELESSGRRNEIRFHYTHDQLILVETFPYRLADNQWHHIALSLIGTRVKLLVDCSPIYERVIQSVDRNFTGGKLTLFVGQRNGQHALFRGALQDVKIVTQAHGYLLQCPRREADCTSGAQYNALEQKIEDIFNTCKNMEVKLLLAEERLTELEQCECLKSCHENGTTYREGEMWKPDECRMCRCLNGTIECRTVDCPETSCKSPVPLEGECCPTCFQNCYYNGIYYDHGDDYSPRVCVTCKCHKGKMLCDRQDPDQDCNPLNCPKSERISIQGECCPVCKGTDFCAFGNNCHVNASCINLATRYACQCVSGFKGDGETCTDIDECLSKGGEFGHHCSEKTMCVNIIGSYNCQCSNGMLSLSDDGECEGSANALTPSRIVMFMGLLCLKLF